MGQKVFGFFRHYMQFFLAKKSVKEGGHTNVIETSDKDYYVKVGRPLCRELGRGAVLRNIFLRAVLTTPNSARNENERSEFKTS